MNIHWNKYALNRYSLSSHFSPPPLLACVPHRDAITHRKFLIKLVCQREKKSGKEISSRSQRQLWWEFEMAHERHFKITIGLRAPALISNHSQEKCSILWLCFTTHAEIYPPHQKSETFGSFSFQRHLEQRGISLCGSHYKTMVYLWSDASVS